MPELCVIIAGKIFFPNFRGGARAPPLTPRLLRLGSQLKGLSTSHLIVSYRRRIRSFFCRRIMPLDRRMSQNGLKLNCAALGTRQQITKLIVAQLLRRRYIFKTALPQAFIICNARLLG